MHAKKRSQVFVVVIKNKREISTELRTKCIKNEETSIKHFVIDLITIVQHFVSSLLFFAFIFRREQNMAPQNSTLINLINDDIKSITSERLSPITVQEFELSANSENEVCDCNLKIEEEEEKTLKRILKTWEYSNMP